MPNCIKQWRTFAVGSTGLLWASQVLAQGATRPECPGFYPFPSSRLALQGEAWAYSICVGFLALLIGMFLHMKSVEYSAGRFPRKPSLLELWGSSLAAIVAVFGGAAFVIFLLRKNVNHLKDCLETIHASQIVEKLGGSFIVVMFVLLAIPFLKPPRK